MATITEFTDPYLRTFTPVPPIAAGVCSICHGAPNPGWARCRSCFLTIQQVSRPITRVVPITIYPRGGPMHHLLYSYKNGPEQLRGRLLPRVAALLARFLQNHGACIGARDTITIVPSSKGRPGLHPLMQALMMVRDLASDTEDLLRPGSQPAGHLIARDESFTAVTRLDGQRVLLVDDTFTTTTGAEIQSAASALQLAGAIIPAAVVIGRFINPGFSESAQRLWERAEARPFNFDACCLCDAPWT